MTYRIAVRGGPSHGHRTHAQKIGEILTWWFLRLKMTDRQTDRQTDTLITMHHTPTWGEVAIAKGSLSVQVIGKNEGGS